jgi:hypothetical protein
MHNLGFRQVEIDGYQFLVNPATGRVLPMVRGGAEGDDNDDGGTPPKTFTQEELDRITGRARAEAKRAAAAELAEALGCTVDEAKAKIAAASAADDATKSETQKALDAAKAAQAEAEAAKANAAAERLAARIERKLTAAGVPEATLARAARLLDVDPDADDEAIAAEIETLQSEVPALFTSTGDGTPPPPGVPPAKQKRQAGGKSAAERARERFANTQRPLAPTAA